VLLAPHLRAADPPPVPVTVVTADGTPAAGAKVWVTAGSREVTAEPAPLTADAAGKLTVPGGEYAQLFARDAAGRVGQVYLNEPWEAAEPTPVKVVLVDTSPREGRLTTPDGKPVA